MIHSLTGTVLETPKNKIILDNGHGCSFGIFALDSDRVRGYSGRFYVHFHFRQDQMALYGFIQEMACTVFKKLILVKGCGPKTALNILNHLTPEDIILAVNGKNEREFLKVPGVGKKMAAQLILDLQHQFMDQIQTISHAIDSGAVIETLEALGYSKMECEQVLAQVGINQTKDEEQLFKTMIQGLSLMRRHK